MSKEAMKLALEALEVWKGYMPALWDKTDEKAIIALREALAEQPAQQALDKKAENARELGLDYEPAQQEPVAWMREGWGPDCGPYIEFYRDDEMGWRDRKEWTALYTSAQRTWVGLTDEEIDELSRTMVKGNKSVNWLCRAIEAKLRSKNEDRN